MTHLNAPTPDEIMVVCMAHQIHAGDFVAQGLATPLVAAAYLLARRTHAPDLYFSSAIGQGICRQPAPISISHIESLWLDQALTNIGFVRAVVDALPNLVFKEYFRPAQIDPNGNFNNIAFGKDYRKPRLRLPGTGGIPDLTTFIHGIYLYVPRHSRLTFVPKLDFCSGLGHNPLRKHGAGAQHLVSDLGQFDFANGRMRLLTTHPGVSISHIQARTGFEFEIADDLSETPAPTEEEVDLLRREIDPWGVRKLELLSGVERRDLLHQILDWEEQAFPLAKPILAE